LIGYAIRLTFERRDLVRGRRMLRPGARHQRLRWMEGKTMSDFGMFEVPNFLLQKGGILPVARLA
jgi:hypothetical protein